MTVDLKILRIVLSIILASAPLSYSMADTSMSISQVKTDFQKKEVMISGSNFGSGPNVILYDTFDSNVSQAGTPLPKTASQIGTWSEFDQTDIPVFFGLGRSGSNSFKAYDGPTQKNHSISLKFDGTQEFFVSYWVYLEGPDLFPGFHDAFGVPPRTRTFPPDSSFKMLWVFDTDVRGDSSDVVLPTHIGGGQFYLAGNDTNLVTGVGNEWWSWDHWMRLSFWLKADPENPTVSGTIHFDTLSQDKGLEQRVYDAPIFDDDGPALKQYQNMSFPGWIRKIKNSSTNVLYDDIYISTGSNAAARVELGDEPSLADVTRLELLTIQSWSDTDIQATASTVENGALQNLYLYITSGDGETNSQGIPLISPPAQIKSIDVR